MHEILSTKLGYEGRLLKLRVETVRVTGGQTVTRDVIEHPGSVSIVPIDEEDRVILVRQYRPAVANTLLEIPAGTREPGESPKETAFRELREEIGMQAERLREIGRYYLAPGYSSELMYAYVASGLRPAPLPRDLDEDIRLESIPFTELAQQVARGVLRDVKTVSAVLFLAHERGLYGG